MKAFTLLLALLVFFTVCKKTPRPVDKPAAKQVIEDIIDELFFIQNEDEDDDENGFFDDFFGKFTEVIQIVQPFIEGLMKPKNDRFDNLKKLHRSAIKGVKLLHSKSLQNKDYATWNDRMDDLKEHFRYAIAGVKPLFSKNMQNKNYVTYNQKPFSSNIKLSEPWDNWRIMTEKERKILCKNIKQNELTWDTPLEVKNNCKKYYKFPYTLL